MSKGISVMLLLAVLTLLASPYMLAAAETSTKITTDGAQSAAFWGAAVVVGLGSLGAGIAVGLTGSAAVGALAEKPELIGKLLIIVGLAEGIAIYGLITAIMILGRI
ncbi:MAG: ATP synthase subunit C [Candidatus Wallbacteria bacterium]|nr:ATP synthase subunit C [Candidatus Wallbacteria bacterium]